MKLHTILIAATFNLISAQSFSIEHQTNDSSQRPSHDLLTQREHLKANTHGKGFGPQSPRDIDSSDGKNDIEFQAAPAYDKMNLCNIHFHKNAEHKGGEFTKYAGSGDGAHVGGGFQFSGQLNDSELKPVSGHICKDTHGELAPGDTIEVHYVHTSAHTAPGPTLNACFNEAIMNPQLRVEAQVYVLVNDETALDFTNLAEVKLDHGIHQAIHIPKTTGNPVQYAGSTTGPGYNETGSPYQVTWDVYPKVAKVNINSLGKWCEANIFNEDHAHGVRNLVVNPDLLSKIQ